ncbi:MAG: hypothetical protein NC394_07520 [Bacteroides sp.]|nr:hypothetical protein [Bacteroides sp.]
MKKFLALTVIISFISLLSACSVNKDTENESAPREEETAPTVSETETAAETSKAAEKTEEASEDIESPVPPDAFLIRQYVKCTDPIATVRNYIEAEKDRSYVKYLEFVAAQIDEERTEFDINVLKDAGLYDKPIDKGTDKTYDDVNFAVVKAEFIAIYDVTKVPYNIGYLRTKYSMWQDRDTGLWTVKDVATPQGGIFDDWGGMTSKELKEYCPSFLEWEPTYEGERYKSVYWQYESSSDPVEVVKSALENHADRDFVTTLTVDSIELYPEETELYSQRRRGSELAKILNISDDLFDSGHIASVYTEFYVEYGLIPDNCTKFFYLWQDEETSEWHIFETSPYDIDKNHNIPLVW